MLLGEASIPQRVLSIGSWSGGILAHVGLPWNVGMCAGSLWWGLGNYLGEARGHAIKAVLRQALGPSKLGHSSVLLA